MTPEKVLQLHWFKYIRPEPFELNDAHPEYDLELESREVYGLEVDTKVNIYLYDKSDLDIRFTVKREVVEELLDKSMPYGGSIEGTQVERSSAGIFWSHFKATNEKAAIRIDTGDDLSQYELDDKAKTRITAKSKQIDLKFNLLEEPTKMNGTHLEPFTSEELKLWEKAQDYIGNLVKLNTSTFTLSTNRISTMISMYYNTKVSARKVLAMTLCMKQLQMINGGTLNYQIVAQAVTHELGHYVFSNALKNSDRLKWTRMVGGLNIHKDQYKHGYSYPWYDEHFAMMAEYMVHGKCARKLQSTIGVEIVEKYFDNRYLRDAPTSKYYTGK